MVLLDRARGIREEGRLLFLPLARLSRFSSARLPLLLSFQTLATQAYNLIMIIWAGVVICLSIRQVSVLLEEY